MTEFIHAQCPNCSTQYRVSIEQVGRGKINARCKKCDTAFVLTEHLVNNPIHQTSLPTKKNKNNVSSSVEQASPVSKNSTTNQDSKPLNHPTNPQPPATQDNNDLNDDNELIHDDMIHDDMEEEEDINAWDGFDEDEFAQLASRPAPNSQISMSNSIHNNPDEDSWLEDLLAGTSPEESKNEDNSVNDVDLSSLLGDIGVEDKGNSPSSELANQPIVQSNSTTPAYIAATRTTMSSILPNLLWALGCVVLLLLLFAQYVFFNLDNLVKHPDYRASLQSFCNVVMCALPNAELDQLTVSNQAFKANENSPNKTDVVGALINNGSSEQLYPNLKVTLLSGNQVKADFIAEPKDYLVVSQRFLGGDQATLFRLTVQVPTSDITQVSITPFY